MQWEVGDTGEKKKLEQSDICYQHVKGVAVRSPFRKKPKCNKKKPEYSAGKGV